GEASLGGLRRAVVFRMVRAGQKAGVVRAEEHDVGRPADVVGRIRARGDRLSYDGGDQRAESASAARVRVLLQPPLAFPEQDPGSGVPQLDPGLNARRSVQDLAMGSM